MYWKCWQIKGYGRAMSNVAPSQLMNARLFDFRSLGSLRSNLADELDAAVGVHHETVASTLVPVTLAGAN